MFFRVLILLTETEKESGRKRGWNHLLGENMTAPHRYIENQFVRISRGTLNNLPLIVADEDGSLQAELRFHFARVAYDCEIRILALNVEPFGYEAIIFDPKMRRSEFLKHVNQSISLAVKSRFEHRESLWSNRKPGNVPILDLETLKNEILKVCITPVQNGYVRKVEDWELPTIGPSDWGIETKCPHPEAPDLFIAKECPGLIILEAKMASLVNKDTIKFSWIPEFSDEVIALKEGLILEIAAFEDAEKGRRKHVLGVTSCRIRKRFLKEKYQHPWKYMDHRKTILCASSELFEEIKDLMKIFYRKYHECLISFIKDNMHGFPTGTLKMRTLFRCVSKRTPDDDLFHFSL